MTREPVTVAPSTSVAEAVESMHGHGIRHLPVLERGRLVGLLSDRDLCPALADADPAGSGALVSDFMTPDPLTVGPRTSVDAAARLMTERKLGCLPVLEDGRLVGVVTKTDLLRALTELLGGRERHSRIEIVAPNRPGELARVVRLIGIDHGINISGVVVLPPEGARAHIILHLDTEDVAEVAENLRLLGYEAAGDPAVASPA